MESFLFKRCSWKGCVSLHSQSVCPADRERVCRAKGKATERGCLGTHEENEGWKPCKAAWQTPMDKLCKVALQDYYSRVEFMKLCLSYTQTDTQILLFLLRDLATFSTYPLKEVFYKYFFWSPKQSPFWGRSSDYIQQILMENWLCFLSSFDKTFRQKQVKLYSNLKI